MTDQDPAIALFDRWTAMWNGNLDLAPEIMATHFVLRYGQPGTEPMDAVHTPEQLQQLIARWRKMRRDPVFRAEGRPIKEI
ncbi:hypothetical protein DLM20_25500, partial [Salmonella enterica subsp. enterica serovar Java]|nr:hypothetical protein [Salmonella enterica subsp. enterica serovar Java]